MPNSIPGKSLVSVDRYDTDGAHIWTNPGASMILVEGNGGGAGGGGAGTTGAGQTRFTWYGLTAQPGQVLIYGAPDTLAINIGAGGAGGQGVGAVSVAGSDGEDTTVTGDGISLTFAKGKALQAESLLTVFPNFTVTANVNMGPHVFTFPSGVVLVNPLPVATPYNGSILWMTSTNGRSIQTMIHGAINYHGTATVGSSANADGVILNSILRGAGGVPGYNQQNQVTPRLGSNGIGGLVIIRAFV